MSVAKMNLRTEFTSYIAELESKLQALVSMEPIKVDALPSGMPKEGVYVFMEGDKALYVGRSKNLRRRLRYHCATGVPDAPFAFRLAREATGYTDAAYTKKGSRKDLLSQSEFKAAYAGAKARIREMDVRFVAEPDPIKQALLEIYAAVVLQACYNDFETH